MSLIPITLEVLVLISNRRQTGACSRTLFTDREPAPLEHQNGAIHERGRCDFRRMWRLTTIAEAYLCVTVLVGAIRLIEDNRAGDRSLQVLFEMAKQLSKTCDGQARHHLRDLAQDEVSWQVEERRVSTDRRDCTFEALRRNDSKEETCQKQKTPCCIGILVEVMPQPGPVPSA